MERCTALAMAFCGVLVLLFFFWLAVHPRLRGWNQSLQLQLDLFDSCVWICALVVLWAVVGGFGVFLKDNEWIEKAFVLGPLFLSYLLLHATFQFRGGMEIADFTLPIEFAQPIEVGLWFGAILTIWAVLRAVARRIGRSGLDRGVTAVVGVWSQAGVMFWCQGMALYGLPGITFIPVEQQQRIIDSAHRIVFFSCIALNVLLAAIRALAGAIKKREGSA